MWSNQDMTSWNSNSEYEQFRLWQQQQTPQVQNTPMASNRVPMSAARPNQTKNMSTTSKKIKGCYSMAKNGQCMRPNCEYDHSAEAMASLRNGDDPYFKAAGAAMAAQDDLHRTESVKGKGKGKDAEAGKIFDTVSAETGEYSLGGNAKKTVIKLRITPKEHNAMARCEMMLAPMRGTMNMSDDEIAAYAMRQHDLFIISTSANFNMDEWLAATENMIQGLKNSWAPGGLALTQSEQLKLEKELKIKKEEDEKKRAAEQREEDRKKNECFQQNMQLMMAKFMERMETTEEEKKKAEKDTSTLEKILERMTEDRAEPRDAKRQKKKDGGASSSNEN